MLILTRKPGESLYIGDTVKVTIVEIKGHQIRVGIDAPKELRIYREEIYLQILEENKKAAETTGLPEGLDNLSAAWRERSGAAAEGSDGGKRKDWMSGFQKVGGKSSTASGAGPEIVVRKKKRTDDV